ncbi:PDZ domain-containing protein [Moraxella haemolytica]|uniref:M61 family metallopeptidase n=1 Tax=Moraxella haemolytica TaxID=2904119 RepID=UPI00254374B5|nr:PDZ domain-containing protein [Moraxella sp. ZY171148]WII95623.1 PDZ domain-containing protein [Moraxella sp. ZY171148]
MNYLVNFRRFYAHLVDVSLSFVAGEDAPILWLPTWIAGSYMIREFSKNITLVQYEHNGKLCDSLKLSKNSYQLSHIKAGDEVKVHYEVYCHDLSVRAAFVDNTRLFGNFSSLLLMVQGQENNLANITLQVPNAFYAKNPNATLACGLGHTKHSDDDLVSYQLSPITAFECYDYPFEIASQDEFDFVVHDEHGTALSHRFFIAGKHRGNLERLKTDVAKICQTYLDELGTAPFNDYTFMTMITGSDYGGLEHINSTALVSPRTDLPTAFEPAIPSDDYQRYLGLCSHEYFHAWWVKTVRPDVMMTTTLQTEAPTPLLWVFEGFTSYIDDLMLLRSGVIDKISYLNRLTAAINRYYQTEGRDLQSVAESSFDAWIKLYRADENYTNQGVSYYNKGTLIALLLDLTLIKHSNGKYRLFDVIKAFYQKALAQDNKRFGMTHENLGEVITGFIPYAVWQSFFDDYVVGRVALPIEEMLSDIGITIQAQTTQKPWGMTCDESGVGLTVKHLVRHGAASLAGISTGDVIIAIDGIKANQKQLQTASKHQSCHHQSVSIHAFRRDELMIFEVGFDTYEYRQFTLQENRPNQWLG